MEGQSEIDLLGEQCEEASFMGRLQRDDGSGSDNNFDGLSGDDEQEVVEEDQPRKRKKYHRHTPHQIQELEAFFKECPHPDEKQRLELSRRLGLETKQIKFWFQNRRTQLKTQIERHENVMLREDNNRLRNENDAMKTKLSNPVCSNCGGTAIFTGNFSVSYEEHKLRAENLRLKDELARIRSLADKFLGKPLPNAVLPLSPAISDPGLEFPMPTNEFDNSNVMSAALPVVMNPKKRIPTNALGIPSSIPAISKMGNGMPSEKSVYIELAIGAMNELIRMVEADCPLWTRTLDGAHEVFNHEEYLRMFAPSLGMRPRGFATEASRDTGVVLISSLAAVEILMDATRWSETFPCIVSRSSTAEVISSGVRGNRNGALEVMNAELQLLSPLVSMRQVRFLRFCKQHGEGMWAVVDVSTDISPEGLYGRVLANCRRLPSGCILQDLPNGCSKVTWLEHSEYDESVVHPLYRRLLSSGMGFGAKRWIASLQRHCESLATFMSCMIPNEDFAGVNPSGRRNMLKLAQRMTDNLCSGICASPQRGWEVLHLGNISISKDVRVMTRKNITNPGEPPGIVLSAATSIWMPVPHETLFTFLCNEQLRSEWDILSRGGPLQEMVHLAKGQRHGNSVSLLRGNGIGTSETSMVILQETWTDVSGSLIAYAPVDVPSINSVMGGGDPNCVPLLPSGFAILPDGPTGMDALKNPDGTMIVAGDIMGGCLLTVGFQILVSSTPSAKLTPESVETVRNLLTCTIQKIKTALQLV